MKGKVLLFVFSCLVASCSRPAENSSADPLSKLLTLRYLKAADVFGAHRLESHLEINASGPGGESMDRLLEDLRVDQNGNYQVTRRRFDGDAPWELLSIGSQYLVVHPGGKIESLQPGMLGSATRERVGESWRTVLEPFRDYLLMTEIEETTVEGRKVKTYKLELSEVQQRGKPGAVTQSPERALGRLKVDVETGYPLRVEFTGAYIRTDDDVGPVTVRVTRYVFAVRDFGKVPEITMNRMNRG